jgi:hypothetical protein
MQQVDEGHSRLYAWLTLALFAGFALVIGAALLTQPTDMQVARNDSPLPVQHVVPPITQPAGPSDR